jgi:hypothetical protein
VYTVDKLFCGLRPVGCNFVQGHHHGVFDIQYLGTPYLLNWGMTVGCLIDDAVWRSAYNSPIIRTL